MISIIISSINEKLLSNISSNISETVGVPFEIISIENKEGKGICEIYNQGATKARFSILCFMHEDIEIHTNLWGQLVIDCFNNNPSIGLVGVAGSTYKTLTPSGWQAAGVPTDYINIIQYYKHSLQQPIHIYRNPRDEVQTQVAAIDGVWFCTTKAITQKFLFDEVTFKGFHAYDIDFSLLVGKQYKVVVIYQLLLSHFSEGLYDSKWLTEILKLHKKWNSYLPLCVEDLTSDQISRIEKVTFRRFVMQCINLNGSANTALSFLFFNRRFFEKFSNLFVSLVCFVFKQKLSKRQ